MLGFVWDPCLVVVVVVVVDNPGFLNNNLTTNLYKNKPAAQAAGADHSQCNSTNKPKPPLQWQRCNAVGRKGLQECQYNVGKAPEGINYLQTVHGKEQC